jgi:RNA polymerase sigma-70 factor, ECF subfamily
VEVRRDDSGGFEELYQQSRCRLAGQLFAFTGDRQGAFDLVQEAFVRTWERWERVADYDDPEAYVRRVAFNLAKSQWRRLGRIRQAVGRAGSEAQVDTDTRHDLVVALSAIPRTEREAIVRYYLADEPIDQIAREMHAPAGTVKSWLSRGRSRLAARLGVDDHGEVTAHE